MNLTLIHALGGYGCPCSIMMTHYQSQTVLRFNLFSRGGNWVATNQLFSPGFFMHSFHMEAEVKDEPAADHGPFSTIDPKEALNIQLCLWL